MAEPAPVATAMAGLSLDPKPNLQHPVILSLLPGYIHNLDDYLALTSGSRIVRDTIHTHTSPHTHLLLAYASRRTFFRPDPFMLLVHLARGLSHWASLSPDNNRRMVQSFWHGAEAVLALAVSLPDVARAAGWGREKPREVWEWRMRVFNPLGDLVDRCVGAQWQAQEDFWEQEDAYTLEADPEGVVLRLIMYGELFGGAWRRWVAGEEVGEVAFHESLPTRLEYLKYLLPDWHTVLHPFTLGGRSVDVECSRTIRPDETLYHIQPIRFRRLPGAEQNDGELNDPLPTNAGPAFAYANANANAVTPVTQTRSVHPIRAVQSDVGPYVDHYLAAERRGAPRGTAMPLRDEHIAAVDHLLCTSTKWTDFLVTAGVLDRGAGAGADPEAARVVSDESWQSPHLRGAVWMYGLRGAEAMAILCRRLKGQEALMDDACAELVQEWQGLARRFAGMEEPQRVEVGKRTCYEVPCIAREAQMLLAHM